jgi:hypothetical protein
MAPWMVVGVFAMIAGTAVAEPKLELAAPGSEVTVEFAGQK